MRGSVYGRGDTLGNGARSSLAHHHTEAARRSHPYYGSATHPTPRPLSPHGRLLFSSSNHNALVVHSAPQPITPPPPPRLTNPQPIAAPLAPPPQITRVLRTHLAPTTSTSATASAARLRRAGMGTISAADIPSFRPKNQLGTSSSGHTQSRAPECSLTFLGVALEAAAACKGRY